MNRICKTTLWLVMMFYGCAVYAQNVSNVTAEQVGKTIHVSYDLDKAADISLFVSMDGGGTYTQLYKVSGDVGKTIGPGHKTIVWDVQTEVKELHNDNVMFKVKVDANAEAQWQKQLREAAKKEEEERRANEIAKAKEVKEREKALAMEAKANEKEAKEKEKALAMEAKANEKEAKDKEKALEKEKKANEQEIKKEERRSRMQSMPYSTFFTFNSAFTLNTYGYNYKKYMPYSVWSYGFKVGQMKIVGWYVDVMTNFRFKGWKHPFQNGQHYWLTDRKPIRLSAQTGLVIRPCRPMSMLFGVGYGYRTFVYKTIDNEWYSYPKQTLHGVDVSFGFLFDIKGFALSFEAVTTNFRSAELKVGLGFCLPTDNKNTKKQTVKVLKNEKF